MMIRSLKQLIAATASLLLASLSRAPADDLRVDGISIVERGIFRGRSGTKPIAESHFGSVAKVRDITLVQSTATIHARKGIRFGVRYVIDGAPAGASLEIRLVTRFPQAGLFDPKVGIRHFESAYTVRTSIGGASYREFMFDHGWEIIAGEWVFEFWQGGRLIGSQRFCVLDVDSIPNPSGRPNVPCELFLEAKEVVVTS